MSFWSIACERQTRRLRETLLRSILHKEISYFDINKTGELNTRLTDDVNKVHDGTGDKLGSAIQFFSAFVAGLALGYMESICFIKLYSIFPFRLIKGWKLTLVILSVSPILFTCAVVFTTVSRESKIFILYEQVFH